MWHRQIKVLLAGGPPLVAYFLSASGYGYWQHSGALIATAMDVGIAPPPSSPLASIVLSAANLLPFGALSFRVTILCSVLCALAATLLFFAFETTLKSSHAIRKELTTPVSLAATWWVAGSQAWWAQAVRPEVYALQAALLCLTIARLLRASVCLQRDVRPLYQAALAFGLALSNRYDLALVLVLPMLWLLVGIARTYYGRPLIWSSLFLGAGLLTYILLPLRALGKPYLNIGEPSSPARFLWAITAHPFPVNHLIDVPTSAGRRWIEEVLMTNAQMHSTVIVAALFGACCMLAKPATRKLGLFWSSVWVVFVLAWAVLGSTPRKTRHACLPNDVVCRPCSSGSFYARHLVFLARKRHATSILSNRTHPRSMYIRVDFASVLALRRGRFARSVYGHRRV